MEVRVSGAASSPGNHTRAWCSRGISPPTGSMTQLLRLKSSCASARTVAIVHASIDACTIATVRAEAQLDFSLKSWVILPVGGDIPREHQARVWFPGEDAAPLTRTSIVVTLVPAAPNARLDHRVHCIGFADFVGCQRPPRAHL